MAFLFTAINATEFLHTEINIPITRIHESHVIRDSMTLQLTHLEI